VESRRYLVRAANTGISAVIDPFGEVVYKTKLYKKECFDYVVKSINYLTFYTKYGDLFVCLCLLFVLFYIMKNRGMLFRKIIDNDKKN